MQYFQGNSDSLLTCWHSQILQVTEIFNVSDWLRWIKWHHTVFSLVTCNFTQPSDWLPPDWPQIVTNCTEQVSPQHRSDTTHWSLVMTAFGVMTTMLSLFYTLIQSNTRSRSYMGGDWSTSLGLRATWKISSERFLMTLHKVPQNTWFVIFQTLFVIGVLKVSTLIDPWHYGTTSWFDIGFTTTLDIL